MAVVKMTMIFQLKTITTVQQEKGTKERRNMSINLSHAVPKIG